MPTDLESDNSFTFVFSDGQSTLRLDQFVFSNLNLIRPGDFSRTQIAESIRNANCKVNNEIVKKPSSKLNSGDIVSILIASSIAKIIPDPSIKFEIIFEDESILVISKPAGLVVHPAPGVKGNTLVNGLYSHLASSISTELLEEPERIGIVHRLDKDTSGVMVVAKNMRAKRNLQKQLTPPRTMKRIYHALVFGGFKNKRGVTQSFDDNSRLKELELHAPISRHPINRTRYKVEFGKTNFHSREAGTIFRVLDSKNEFYLLECELMTGRTHQIRVHLEYLGVVLLGDPVYGPRLKIDSQLVGPFIYHLSGQLLHARTIEFLHPETQKKLSFNAQYTDNFNSALQILGLHSSNH